MSIVPLRRDASDAISTSLVIRATSGRGTTRCGRSAGSRTSRSAAGTPPSTRPRRVVHAHVEHVHARLVLAVEPADVGQRAAGLDHHGDAVQLVVTRVKDVPAQTAAPKCRSNALTRSAAMTWGLRPSIWWRWTKCTTSPSRSSAIDGLLG